MSAEEKTTTPSSAPSSGKSGSKGSRDKMISRTGKPKSLAVRLWEDAPMRPEGDKEFGDDGTHIELRGNSYPMDLRVETIHMYDVTYRPDLPTDARRQRRRVVLDHLEQTIRKVYGTFFYDNTRIWALKKIAEDHDFKDEVAKGPDGEDQYIHVRHLKEIKLLDVPLEEQEMIMHIVLQKTLRETKMVRCGRSFHDKNVNGGDEEKGEFFVKTTDKTLPSVRLWRGWQISVEPTIEGLKLKCDVNHRIIHHRSVREMMNEVERVTKARLEGRPADRIARDTKEGVLAELQGGAVITLYNMRVWRIHDIDYDISINDKFIQDNGVPITYKQYFKDRYGQVVESDKPGMLIHVPKKKGANLDRKVVLAPELCFQTGLTKQMKANYRYMRAVSDKTRLGAGLRHKVGFDMVKKLEDTAIGMNIAHVAKARGVDESEINLNKGVEAWELDQPLHIQAEEFNITGRVLPGVRCITKKKGQDFVTDSVRGLGREWGRCGFANEQMKKLKDWAILVEKDYLTEANTFKNTFQQLCIDAGLWGTLISDKPHEVFVGDHAKLGKKQNVVWQERIEKTAKKYPDCQLMVCILPDRGPIVTAIYAFIKEASSCDLGLLTQCIKAKSIQDLKRANAIVRNLIKQMMTKVGNVPWKVDWNLPDKSVKFKPHSTMIVGIDVNHDWKRDTSTCGFVASRTDDFTRWNSYMAWQPRGQEIMADAERLFWRSMKDWKKKHQEFPRKIIVFRDGVSTSQLQTVVQGEIVKGFKAAVARLREEKPKGTRHWKPKLTAIVVQKRVTARFLTLDHKSVPPGTVVDQHVVSPRFWDFYLTTCEAPIGGCASSTRYIVVHNELNMTQNDIQNFCHQMCSLYFNWPGPVRVPAPCMYASKVAYLYGTCVYDREPHPDIYHLPYYL